MMVPAVRYRRPILSRAQAMRAPEEDQRMAQEVVLQVSKALKDGSISEERAVEILEFIVGAEVERRLAVALFDRIGIGERLENLTFASCRAMHQGAGTQE